MVAPRLIVCDGLRGAVFQHKAVVVTEHGVSDRRLDTDAGGATGHDKIFDPSIPQDPVEPVSKKPL